MIQGSDDYTCEDYYKLNPDMWCQYCKPTAKDEKLYHCRDCNGPASRQCYRLGHYVDLSDKIGVRFHIEESPRPSVEPEFLVPEDFRPRWEGKRFIECGSCRVKPGTPDLCIWCLYVRERK